MTAAANFGCSSAAEIHGCQHLGRVIHDIRGSIGPISCAELEVLSPAERESLIDAAARRNVLRSVQTLLDQSRALAGLVGQERIAVVGAMYDVASGEIEFLTHDESNPALVCDSNDHARELTRLSNQ